MTPRLRDSHHPRQAQSEASGNGKSMWTWGYLFCLDFSLRSHSSLSSFCHGGVESTPSFLPKTLTLPCILAG